MGKSKFKIGDKVYVKRGSKDEIGRVGKVTNIRKYRGRLCYIVKYNDSKYPYSGIFYADMLLFSDLHSLAEHSEKENDIRGPYGYVPSFNKEDAKLNSPIFQPMFKVGDIVIDPMAKFIPNIGKIVKFVEENGKYYYTVEFTDKKTNIYLEQQLCKGSLNDKFLYDEFVKIGELSEGIGSKDKCKYCKTPFEEIEESKEEPGVCEYCIEQRHLIPEVNLRKACNVDLNEFSTFGHEGDWLEVTEWTNHEGFDVTIHYANDYIETDHNFRLSYDELSAIINIVNKFGMLPAVFTKAPEE